MEAETIIDISAPNILSLALMIVGIIVVAGFVLKAVGKMRAGSDA
jgi:hypothetical protein